MKTWAVVPLKSPQHAKSRLGAALTPIQRRALFFALARQAVEALLDTAGIARVAVITASDEVAAFASGLGAEVLRQTADAGTAHAFSFAIERLRPVPIRQVLMIAGDLPLISPLAVQTVLDAGAAEGVVAVPDRHGRGTNALLCSPPEAIAPSFGPDSLRRHLALARLAGVQARRLDIDALALDLDVPEDLMLLARSALPLARHLRDVIDVIPAARAA